MTKKMYIGPKICITDFKTETITSINQSSVQTNFNRKNKSVINSSNIINF